MPQPRSVGMGQLGWVEGVEQTPAEHAAPEGQAWLQVPQLALSVLVLVHVPPQSVPDPGQMQLPLTQERGPAHSAPHAPQLALLVSMLVSHPSDATPLQLPKPVEQLITVQAPVEQPLVITCARLHTVPHAPQLDGSTEVLAQKAVAPDPQVVSGDPQIRPQTPAEHT